MFWKTGREGCLSIEQTSSMMPNLSLHSSSFFYQVENTLISNASLCYIQTFNIRRNACCLPVDVPSRLYLLLGYSDISLYWLTGGWIMLHSRRYCSLVAEISTFVKRKTQAIESYEEIHFCKKSGHKKTDSGACFFVFLKVNSIKSFLPQGIVIHEK